MATPTSWKQVQAEIIRLQAELEAQHFIIDIAYRLYTILSAETKHRPDLNLPAIATYWADHIYNHYVLNGYALKESNVFLQDLEYYSFLDLTELNDNNTKLGEKSYIVDYIAGTTDAKDGEELDDWIANSNFGDLVQDAYNDNHDMLIEDGALEVRKNKPVVKERYWNYSNWLFQLRVMDQNFQPVVIFMLGTYSDYK